MKKIVYLSLAFSVLIFCKTLAQVPQKINYQGFLTENNLPVTTQRTIALTIKDGTTTRYTESFNVTPDKGLFSVTLGDSGPVVPTNIWGKVLTVKISIAGDTITTVPFTTVPYAFMATNVADNAVTTIKLVDNAVTNAKLSSDIDASKLTAGTLSIARIADGTVTSAKITDGSIAGADLAANSISSSNIVDGTIANADISASAAIAGTKIDGTTITGISATNVTSGTLPIARIADDAVTSVKITDGAIMNIDISGSAAIAGTKIDGTTITGLNASNISSGTLSIARIADDAVTSVKIADGTITSTDIFDGTITSTDILDGTIASGDILDGTITSADIFDGTVTTTDIANATVTDADISASAAIAGSKITPTFGAQNISTTGYATATNGLRVGSATAPSAGNLEVDGYSRLGSGSPIIQMKKITGTTAASEGAEVLFVHGLNAAKIISVSVIVEASATFQIHEAYTNNVEYQFNWYLTDTQIRIWNTTGNSGNILSKPLKILITYEQ